MWKRSKPWRHERPPIPAATRSRGLNSEPVKLLDARLCAQKTRSAARKGRFALAVMQVVNIARAGHINDRLLVNERRGRTNAESSLPQRLLFLLDDQAARSPGEYYLRGRSI
jgi:hypothetical protein